MVRLWRRLGAAAACFSVLALSSGAAEAAQCTEYEYSVPVYGSQYSVQMPTYSTTYVVNNAITKTQYEVADKTSVTEYYVADKLPSVTQYSVSDPIYQTQYYVADPVGYWMYYVADPLPAQTQYYVSDPVYGWVTRYRYEQKQVWYEDWQEQNCGMKNYYTADRGYPPGPITSGCEYIGAYIRDNWHDNQPSYHTNFFWKWNYYWTTTEVPYESYEFLYWSAPYWSSTYYSSQLLQGTRTVSGGYGSPYWSMSYCCGQYLYSQQWISSGYGSPYWSTQYRSGQALYGTQQVFVGWSGAYWSYSYNSSTQYLWGTRQVDGGYGTPYWTRAYPSASQQWLDTRTTTTQGAWYWQDYPATSTQASSGRTQVVIIGWSTTEVRQSTPPTSYQRLVRTEPTFAGWGTAQWLNSLPSGTNGVDYFWDGTTRQVQTGTTLVWDFTAPPGGTATGRSRLTTCDLRPA